MARKRRPSAAVPTPIQLAMLDNNAIEKTLVWFATNASKYGLTPALLFQATAAARKVTNGLQTWEEIGGAVLQEIAPLLPSPMTLAIIDWFIEQQQRMSVAWSDDGEDDQPLSTFRRPDAKRSKIASSPPPSSKGASGSSPAYQNQSQSCAPRLRPPSGRALARTSKRKSANQRPTQVFSKDKAGKAPAASLCARILHHKKSSKDSDSDFDMDSKGSHETDDTAMSHSSNSSCAGDSAAECDSSDSGDERTDDTNDDVWVKPERVFSLAECARLANERAVILVAYKIKGTQETRVGVARCIEFKKPDTGKADDDSAGGGSDDSERTSDDDDEHCGELHARWFFDGWSDDNPDGPLQKDLLLLEVAEAIDRGLEVIAPEAILAEVTLNSAEDTVRRPFNRLETLRRGTGTVDYPYVGTCREFLSQRVYSSESNTLTPLPKYEMNEALSAHYAGLSSKKDTDIYYIVTRLITGISTLAENATDFSLVSERTLATQIDNVEGLKTVGTCIRSLTTGGPATAVPFWLAVSEAACNVTPETDNSVANTLRQWSQVKHGHARRCWGCFQTKPVSLAYSGMLEQSHDMANGTRVPKAFLGSACAANIAAVARLLAAVKSALCQWGTTPAAQRIQLAYGVHARVTECLDLIDTRERHPYRSLEAPQVVRVNHDD